jgi:hypothetical protein
MTQVLWETGDFAVDHFIPYRLAKTQYIKKRLV